MSNYIEVGPDEGYFAEDRDTVYCKHGKYIGYPGGPDYICQYCEDGADTLVKFPVWNVWLPLEGDERHLLQVLYSADQVELWKEKIGSSEMGIEFEESFEYSWIRKEDES